LPPPVTTNTLSAICMATPRFLGPPARTGSRVTLA